MTLGCWGRTWPGSSGGFGQALGRPLAYLWTAEWHKTGHGLHVHFAIGEYIRRSLIEQSWAHGFVHIKLLGDLPVGDRDGSSGQEGGRLPVEVRGEGVRG